MDDQAPDVIVQLGGGHADPEQFAAWYPRAILNTAALLVASFLLALFFLGLDKILPPKQAQQAQEPVPGPAEHGGVG